MEKGGGKRTQVGKGSKVRKKERRTTREEVWKMECRGKERRELVRRKEEGGGMKTENEENLEKVRKEGVRMRGQGEGGRKEGNKERGGMEDVYISSVSLLLIFLL